ncbi:hypothetical protein R3W88_014250 [Solanum pinnatisectum]|uniref:F-box associated beta-propeller type 3 domain-containing protein n=1 Tax=Solanum pinnatisectum TaxID=50273 RepID=A0AAV9KR69_9SOLN|nr:hypothetical protein R3W88_014250 [Solanum pinnatisectum]
MILLPYQRKNSHSIKYLYYYSLGYEPVEKKYKVLMKIHNSRGHVQNFIFTLSIDISWRKIKVKSCPIKEVIYMMDYLKNSIVAFDLRTENLRVIGLGNDICDNIFDYDLIEVKGKITLLDCCGYFTGRNDLWILENSEKEEWKSRFYDSRDSEIIFIAMKNSILFCNIYDVEKNSWRHLEIHGAPTQDEIYVINFFVENLY